MEDKKKIVLVSVVALLAVVAAIAMGMKTVKGSGETETKFSDVPPKGIGKADKSP